MMLKVPTWLFALLIPVVFIGSCAVSVPPIWRWRERGAVRAVAEGDAANFPVLYRAENGRFVAGLLGHPPSGAKIVLALGEGDEDRANNDLRDSLGWTGEYQFFRVLERQEGVDRVSLEFPTNQAAKLKGWYSLNEDGVVPEHIISYGPGFAFAILPWSMGSGVIGLGVFCIVVKRRKAVQ